MKKNHTPLKTILSCLAWIGITVQVFSAETIEQWYANAQQRIDTLRKGNFGFKIFDKQGNPYQGNVSVYLYRHEYPFGIAFDLYENEYNFGNSYSTTATINASADNEIYQTERWYASLSYAIPVPKSKSYTVTLKFAEIYFTTAGSRLFDVYIEGQKVLSNFDVLAAAGGNNIAFDTSLTVQPQDSVINIDLFASKDNAAIKGLEIRATDDSYIKRINCGGNALTTTSGNFYEADTAYFNKSASRLPSEEDWMKAVMQKYFNYGVSGNSFKWSGIQPQHTAPNYTNFDNAVRFAQSVGWELKAHTLLWGGYNYEDDHAIPRWVKDLPTPQAIYDTCKMRVIREVTRYKGIIKEYDVMNEPLHALYLASVVGDSINWNCFKWARSADPDARLIINDYNVEYNWGDARKYRDLILKMKEMNIPVTGVGMQAHFWQNMRPNLVELVTNVNIVAEAGLPIKFTEFDNGIMPEEEQAKDLVMVTTVAFSHPMMNGIICWGLSDKGAWREKSGLFTETHRPKKAADTLLYLTQKLWTTRFDTTYSSSEGLNFKGYYGTYKVEVKFGDTVKVFTVPCLMANKDSVFVLYEQDAVVKGPVVITAQLIDNKGVEILFDKEIDPATVVAGDFKFFSDHPIRIVSVVVDSIDKKRLLITLQQNITPNDYLTVYYFPGNLKGDDGSQVNIIGPLPISNTTAGIIAASVVNNGNKVLAQFNRKIINLLENQNAFFITVNSSPINITSVEYMDGDSTKALFTLQSNIKKGDRVNIRYVEGTLRPVTGLPCATTGDILVTNLWPSVVKAEVDKKGRNVIVTFNTLLQQVMANAENFSIVVNDKPAEIVGMTIKGTDSTIVTFNLADTILKGQKVTLTYTPGDIAATNGNMLEKLTGVAVWNYSIETGIRNISTDAHNIFPNPAKDLITINSGATVEKLVIVDAIGRIVLTKKGGYGNNMTIDVSGLPSGIYFVKLYAQGQMETTKLMIQR
ncbi:MAG: endo-1,4-beta-xylanase [Bacteroidales bacterium]